ncbi:MAG TPA: FGGY family carbohydrate kinase [Armatimonadota bacterium]|jgi:xylulokinase
MSTPSFVLGVDLGTSGCKVCLLSAAGAVTASCSVGYATASPQPLWAEQDAHDWPRAVTDAVRRVLAESGIPATQVAGLALTSAAHIGVLLDAQGEPVRPAILWHDQRSAAEVAELEREAGAEILRLTCQAVSTGWTLPHLRWVRRHDPAAWARTRTVLLSKDYLAQWLVGRAVTDPATALSAQLLDTTTGQWSKTLCRLAGITPKMLPEICPATTIIGGLTADAARQLGLVACTPVVLGSVDSATELLAAGVVTPGQRQLRLASAGGVQCVTPAPTPHRQRITYPHLITPYWYCQAGTNTCATAVRWGMEVLAGEVSYAAWDAAAAETPVGADGLLFHPYLAGERAPHWDPNLRGSFIGLTLRHGRGHLARALYEGTAFSIRQAMSVLDAPPNAEPFSVVGGGTRSALWVRILADVLGRPLRIPADADSAVGAALLALAALGLADDLPTLAARRSDTGTLVQPIAAHVACYEDAYQRYTQLPALLAPYYAQGESR